MNVAMNKRYLLAVIVVAACSKKSGSSADSVTKADADAVNAMIPADMKGKIEFEVATVDDGMGRHPAKFTVVAPKGWKKGFMPGSLEPADSDHFGSKTMGKTSFTVGSGCDGTCEKKEWAAVVDKVYYKQFTSGQVTGKLIKDDKRPNGRTLVFAQEPKSVTEGTTTMTSGEKKILIITTWWSDDSRKYDACEAELAEPAMGLAAAFEKACTKVTIEGDD
jgi:hypothetical protein